MFPRDETGAASLVSATTGRSLSVAAGTILHGISDTADAAGYTLRESGERFERTGHGDAGGQADSGDPGGGPETDTVFTSRLRTQPKGEPYDLADSFL